VTRELDCLFLSARGYIYRLTDSDDFIMVICEGGFVGLCSYHECRIMKLYSSPNTIRVMNSRRKVWAWHITHVGGLRNTYESLTEKVEKEKTSLKI